MSNKSPELSVVIPVLNCSALTKQCIESIRCNEDYIITIVDNGSTDDTYAMIKKLAEDNNIPLEEIDGETVFLSPEEKAKSEASTVS